nr:hypothetical protein [Kofleriaceae bacterium]
MTAPRCSRPIVAALLVVAQLAGFAHEAAVRHVRCAEHDELVEATDAGATSVYAGDSAIRTVEHGRTPAADHEHCSIANAAHPHACTHQLHVDATRVAGEPQVPAVAPSGHRHDGDRYRFAPKTSPPALAS